LVDNERRHHLLLLVLREAALFTLLHMLFNSLITMRQCICDTTFV
jgi:hypothetical protein